MYDLKITMYVCMYLFYMCILIVCMKKKTIRLLAAQIYYLCKLNVKKNIKRKRKYFKAVFVVAEANTTNDIKYNYPRNVCTYI